MVEWVPDVCVYGNAEAKIFFAEAQGLLAGVAEGGGGVERRGVVEVGDDFVGDVGELAGGGEVGRVDGEEELRLSGFAEWLGAELVGGEASGEHGGHHVEDEGEAGALPVADGERALGGFDGGGVGGEGAYGVEASGNGERRAALAVGGEGSVGELGHRHVENNRMLLAGESDDEGIVADGGGGGSPGREVGEGVRPAEGEEAGLGGKPSVGAAAHPVVGVGESDCSDAVLAGEGDGAVHDGVGVEVAEAAVSVPALDTSEGCGAGGLGVDVDAAVLDHGGEAGEAIEAVGVDAVAGGFGEEAGA